MIYTIIICDINSFIFKKSNFMIYCKYIVSTYKIKQEKYFEVFTTTNNYNNKLLLLLINF